MTQIDELNIDQLIARLENEWQTVRPLLVQIGEPTVEPLIQTFIDVNNSPGARIQVARTLCVIGDPRAIGPLLSYFDDKSNPKRAFLALSFGWLYDERVVERLLEAMVEEDVNVRSSAMCSLVYIGEPRTRELLLRALDCVADGGEPDEIMRSEVITSTRNLMIKLNDRAGFSRAIAPLQWLLHDPDAWIQKNAAKTLAAFDAL